MELKNTDNTNMFESIKHLDGKIEFWYARELMPLLEYDEWRNFLKVIEKASKSIENSYQQTNDHFVEVNKMIRVASGTIKEAVREITDYKLTRHACYLIAQNGDTHKRSIALAQSYFATQTRKQELFEEKQKLVERIVARQKLSETDKKFSGVLTERGMNSGEIGQIKSSGDQALFGKSTQSIKKALGIRSDKPLADFLPTISLKAKDLAMEMTTFNTQKKDLQTARTIENEHIVNNAAVRKTLNENGIYPERLPLEEDVKKLEKMISPEDLNLIPEKTLLAFEKLEIDIRSVNDTEELLGIRKIIQNNQGNSKLLIYYGSKEDTRIIEREIQINPEVLNGLKKYLIVN